MIQDRCKNFELAESEKFSPIKVDVSSADLFGFGESERLRALLEATDAIPDFPYRHIFSYKYNIIADVAERWRLPYLRRENLNHEITNQQQRVPN